MRKRRKKRFSGIGGQAVFEGIMMQNGKDYAVAVRKPDNTIEVVKKEVDFPIDGGVKKVPLIRGFFQFIDSLSLGMSALSISTSFFEEPEPKGLDKVFSKIFGKNAGAVVSFLTTVISVILALAVFVVVPFIISELISNYFCNRAVLSLIEAIIRIAIFVIYILLISLMKDVRNTFMYHGAEHKCINCLESGKELTVKNVARQSRKHNRCGTSFIVIIAIITAVLFFFIQFDALWLKVLVRVALIPVVAGIAYELLRYTGKHNNKFAKVISAPGMWIQSITTKEPTNEMIEVAIKATEAVIDWKQFLIDNFEYEFEEEGVVIGGDSSNTVTIKTEDIENRLREAQMFTRNISVIEIEDALKAQGEKPKDELDIKVTEQTTVTAKEEVVTETPGEEAVTPESETTETEALEETAVEVAEHVESEETKTSAVETVEEADSNAEADLPQEIESTVENTEETAAEVLESAEAVEKTVDDAEENADKKQTGKRRKKNRRR